MAKFPLEVLRNPRQAAAMLAPARLRLVEQLRHEPDSATGLARKLGLPRQKVNYHLRELETAGIVEFVEERRKGNCVERLVRATASRYVISPEALGGAAGIDSNSPAEAADRFSSAYLVALAARCIQDVADLRARADQAGKRLATLTLETEIRFASAAERAAFAEELSACLAHLTARYHRAAAPGGRTFRVFAGAYSAKQQARADGAAEVPSVRMD